MFLEDGACLKITEQELLDFGLRPGDELDGAALARLKEAAGISDVKVRAADLVGRRAMSRRELERKLQERGASQAEARYAAEWLEAIGAIDDQDYAALLVRHYGQMGYGPARVREKLREKGYHCSLVNARFVKPIDEELIREACAAHKLIVTMEENVSCGGFGEHVRDFVDSLNVETRVLGIAIPDEYVEHGNVELLKQETGIDAVSVEEKVVSAWQVVTGGQA